MFVLNLFNFCLYSVLPFVWPEFSFIWFQPAPDPGPSRLSYYYITFIRVSKTNSLLFTDLNKIKLVQI